MNIKKKSKKDEKRMRRKSEYIKPQITSYGEVKGEVWMSATHYETTTAASY